MRAHRLRVLASLTALLALSPSAPGAGGEPPPAIENLVFHQVDWYEAPNVPLQSNSIWGRVSFTYRPRRTTWYLNLAAARPGSASQFWYIRNLPLFGERAPRPRREAVYLDLQRLGLADGQNWSEVQFGLTVDSSIRKKAPKVRRDRTLAVGTSERHQPYCLGSTPVERFVPGGPFPILIDNKPVPDPDPGIPEPVSRPVQEEVAKDCVAASFARSLDWLNQTYGSDKTPTAQEIFEGLLTAGVSRDEDENDNGSPLDEWITAKRVYAAQILGLDMETKVWDGAGLVPPIVGVDEENGDFAEWLLREYAKGAAIEIGYTWSGGRHVVMITKVYRSDRKYRFLTNEMTIAIAVSERVKR